MIFSKWKQKKKIGQILQKNPCDRYEKTSVVNSRGREELNAYPHNTSKHISTTKTNKCSARINCAFSKHQPLTWVGTNMHNFATNNKENLCFKSQPKPRFKWKQVKHKKSVHKSSLNGITFHSSFLIYSKYARKWAGKKGNKRKKSHHFHFGWGGEQKQQQAQSRIQLINVLQ